MAGNKPPRRPAGEGGVIGRARWARLAELRLDGKTLAEIAGDLGCSSAVAGRSVHHPGVLALIEEGRRSRQRTARLHGESTIRDSILALRAALSDGDANVRIKAAIALLDRFGFHPGSGVLPDLEVKAEPSSPEEVAAILDRIPEAMLAAAIARRGGR